MKTMKRISIIICVVLVMLAFIPSSYAIGFSTEEVYNSVFVIYSGRSLGSGFAIGENCIVTNAHVIENVNRVQVVSYNGEVFDAFIVSIDERIDIAILGVPDTTFTPLKVADLSKTGIGEDVYAIGAPNSLAFTLTKGIISSKDRTIGRQQYIQTDAAINSGNSGGPLLNDKGEVLGVNTLKMSDAEGIGLAIPITTVIEYLQSGEIPIDSHGNVEGSLAKPYSPEPTLQPREESEVVIKQSGAVIPLAIFLTLSVLANIILLILLLKKKKTKNNPVVDPSERTDFDIEIYN